jgi:hypothetical protein
MCKVNRLVSAAGLAFAILLLAAPLAHSLEKQSVSVYHARRAALGVKLHGGAAVLFAKRRNWTSCPTGRMRISII